MHFSVIVPHLNQPEFLRQLAESLCKQDFPREQYDVIVVDNGSTEQSLKDVAEIVAQYGYRLEHEEIAGPGPARNKGVASASSEFLAFIDADCQASPGWLSCAAAALASSPDTIFGGDVRILGHDDMILTSLQAFEAVFAYQQENCIRKQNYCLTGNLVAHRDVINRIGPFADMSVAEDWDFGQRATALGVPIQYVPEMIVYHPARDKMEQLRVKWRRHIQHEYNNMVQQNRFAAKWLWRSFLIAGSIPVHAIRILRSNRISGPANRLRGIACLADIRLFRILYMMQMLLSGTAGENPAWNREEPSGG